MSRQARKISSSGFYHVMFRGVNHQHLFEVYKGTVLSVLACLIWYGIYVKLNNLQ
jgi:hypothetical protein